MSSRVYSAAVVGVDAFEVEVEVHTGYGDHGKVTVGCFDFGPNGKKPGSSLNAVSFSLKRGSSATNRFMSAQTQAANSIAGRLSRIVFIAFVTEYETPPC
jgi:hypothetical protein